jgi:hypothetical protein
MKRHTGRSIEAIGGEVVVTCECGKEFKAAEAHVADLAWEAHYDEKTPLEERYDYAAEPEKDA